jgi:hypothetical protein
MYGQSICSARQQQTAASDILGCGQTVIASRFKQRIEQKLDGIPTGSC